MILLTLLLQILAWLSKVDDLVSQGLDMVNQCSSYDLHKLQTSILEMHNLTQRLIFISEQEQKSENPVLQAPELVQLEIDCLQNELKRFNDQFEGPDCEMSNFLLNDEFKVVLFKLVAHIVDNR